MTRPRPPLPTALSISPWRTNTQLRRDQKIHTTTVTTDSTMPAIPPADEYPTPDQLRTPALDAPDSAWTCVGELPAETGEGTDAALDGGHAATLAETPRYGPAVSYEYDHDTIRLHIHMAGAGPTQTTAEEPTPDQWQLTIDGRESEAMGDCSTSTVEYSVGAIQRLAEMTAGAIGVLRALGPAAVETITDGEDDA